MVSHPVNDVLSHHNRQVDSCPTIGSRHIQMCFFFQSFCFYPGAFHLFLPSKLRITLVFLLFAIYFAAVEQTSIRRRDKFHKNVEFDS